MKYSIIAFLAAAALLPLRHDSLAAGSAKRKSKKAAPTRRAKATTPAPRRAPSKGSAAAAGNADASKSPGPVAVDSAASAPAPVSPVTTVARGPLDLLLLQRERHATVSAGPGAPKSLDAVFDRNARTASVVPIGPGDAAYVQIVLDRPRPVEQIDVTFQGEGSYNWTVTGADTLAEMEGKRGSYKVLASPHSVQAGLYDGASFAGPSTFRVYRLECRRVAGTGPVPFGDWALWSPQTLTRLEIGAIVPDVALGGKLPLQAMARFDAGATENVSSLVTWEVDPPTRGTVDAFVQFQPKEPGQAKLVARSGSLRSAEFAVTVLPEALPDWDVTYIERQPRLDYGSPNASLAIGQSVFWFAHIKNYGTVKADSVPIEWRIDGEVVGAGQLPPIDRFAQTEAMLQTKWDGKRHQIQLVVDPHNQFPETCEGNDSLAVQSDALSVGFWVEESTLQYFHRYQRNLSAGSNSWEDWAQRQIIFWNESMQGARAPEIAPATIPAASVRPGPGDRWRLDRIIVVGDGMLPMDQGVATTDPDRRDHTVQLMWGFPAYDPQRNDLYRRTNEKSPDNPFYFQRTLMEALGHVRYLPANSTMASAAAGGQPAP